MGLFDKKREKQFMDAVSSKKAKIEADSANNDIYIFGPLWTEEGKKAFFLSPWIRECIFEKDAPYSKLIYAYLDNEPDSELAAAVLNKFYGIHRGDGKCIYSAAQELYKGLTGNEKIKIPGMGELYLSYPI